MLKICLSFILDVHVCTSSSEVAFKYHVVFVSADIWRGSISCCKIFALMKISIGDLSRENILGLEIGVHIARAQKQTPSSVIGQANFLDKSCKENLNSSHSKLKFTGLPKIFNLRFKMMKIYIYKNAPHRNQI